MLIIFFHTDVNFHACGTFHAHGTFPYLCKYSTYREFFYVHNVFLCFLNLTTLMKLSETNASFFMKVVMLIKLFHAEGEYGCFSISKESLNAYEQFLCSGNFYILVELLYPYGTFSYL